MEELEQAWLVTKEMAVEVRKQDIKIGKVMEGLRNAKSILNECRIRPASREKLREMAQGIIGEAQKDLFLLAEPLGEEFVKKWETELKEVMRGKKFGDFPDPVPTFVPGMPRDGGWVRVSMDIPDEVLEDMGGRYGIEFEKQEGVVLLKGDREALREALANLSSHIKGVRK